MNIVIPMAGIGSRFKQEGYRFNKPLINIVGRPMILWVLDNLNIGTNDTVHLAYNDFIEQDIGTLVKKEYPELNVRSTVLTSQTRGAAETLFAMLKNFSDTELSMPVLSLDCDSIYFYDVISEFRKIGSGTCFYFNDKGKNPIFSYIKMNENDIVEIKEKIRISDHANTGAYGFPSGTTLLEYCTTVLDQGVGTKGEYYTSNIVNLMIRDGRCFKGVNVPVDSFACVGTPVQLKHFLARIKENNDISVRPMRFCFDLDNTLVSFPTTCGDYSTCLPRMENISILRDLHNAGHTIIIQTARRMKTHGGNVGAIIADVGKLTFDQLSLFDIPYDELHFGKPHAHVYVDDLAVNSLVDTAKELGWTNNVPIKQQHPAMVSARSFNDVIRMDNTVVKTMGVDVGAGECFYYKNIPDELSDAFPKLVSVTELPDDVLSIQIEYVKSTSFAQLLCISCITKGRLTALLDTLLRIHSCSVGDLPENADVVLNYSDKVSKRYYANAGVYADNTLFKTIHNALQEYEKSDRKSIKRCIHGDPVFSNVLLTPDNEIKMIDMRGMQGGVCTLGGDAVYDLAKVCQSLMGYDIVLLKSCRPNEQEERYLEELRNHFFSYITRNYPAVNVDDVLTVAASHLYSLVPLHDDRVVREWALEKAGSYIYMH